MSRKQEQIAKILNGETNVTIRCAVELGYNAGFRAGIEQAADLAKSEGESYASESKLCSRSDEHNYIGKSRALLNIAESIRAIKEEG